MLTKGQIRHKQPSAGAPGPLDGKALRRGMLPQLVGRLLQAGKMQRLFQLRQLGGAVDVYQVIFVLEPVDAHCVLLLFCLRFFAVLTAARSPLPPCRKMPPAAALQTGGIKGPDFSIAKKFGP